MDAEQAIHAFWSSFGLTAYDENSVPDDAQLPYITYSISFDSFDYAVGLSASIWYQTTSWQSPTEKIHEIEQAIKNGGTMLPTDNGAVWIRKASPFYQRVGNVDTSIKRVYINVTAEYVINEL